MNNKLSIDDDEASTRFKIIFTLLNKDEPMTLTELRDELKLDKELVYHHLKKLKDEFIVADVDKKYTLHDFFYDENVMEALNSQMKTVVLTILREMKDLDYTEEDLQKAVQNNLELFVQTFSIEIQS